MALDPAVLKKAQYWATDPIFDSQTRNEVGALLEAGNDAELEERFGRDLEFGTAGLRGVMGAGSSRMNIYNIRKAAAAVGRYLKTVNPRPKVAITYDCRINSRNFAWESARVLAGEGVKVLITRQLKPVPLLSYLVRQQKCDGGICITASHNPPEYNGFKVYWKSGGQVTAPHDEGIMKEYLALSLTDISLKDEGIEEVGEELDAAYLDEIAQLSVGNPSPLKVVFTPLHGTAGEILPKALKRFGFADVHVVASQREPDGTFPTVAYPNPEDPAALALAAKEAEALGADVVLGTDPDADRVAVAYLEKGKTCFINGNQLGCLLVDYVLRSRKEAGRLPADPLVVKTIVTTDLETAIAAHYGAHMEETLTGFKWIGRLIGEYERGERTPMRNFVCGGEEANGFLAGPYVRDKDGVSACCVAAAMTAYHKARGLTLGGALDEIYARHGVYDDGVFAVTLPGSAGMAQVGRIMERLRKSPVDAIAGSPITRVRDVSKGVDGLPKSNVLQFFSEDGSRLSVRPSGTEPKIKFYISIRETGGALGDLKARAKTRGAQVQEAMALVVEET